MTARRSGSKCMIGHTKQGPTHLTPFSRCGLPVRKRTPRTSYPAVKLSTARRTKKHRIPTIGPQSLWRGTRTRTKKNTHIHTPHRANNVACIHYDTRHDTDLICNKALLSQRDGRCAPRSREILCLPPPPAHITRSRALFRSPSCGLKFSVYRTYDTEESVQRAWSWSFIFCVRSTPIPHEDAQERDSSATNTYARIKYLYADLMGAAPNKSGATSPSRDWTSHSHASMEM